jgi:membrane protease YdiL (CAAX protease family)
MARIGRAARDPAVAFLLLFPLALLHLSGGAASADLATFSVGLQALAWLGDWLFWALSLVLGVGVLWAIGRIEALELPWAAGSIFLILEGLFWGYIVGPLLLYLTQYLPLQATPLSIAQLHQSVALAAGAGLYEELLFRAGLLTGLYVLLVHFLRLFFGATSAVTTVSFGLALLLSSAAFAWAHSLGDPNALIPDVLAFRLLAGVLFGLLFSWRGLAVAAWAHASYDSLLLFP